MPSKMIDVKMAFTDNKCNVSARFDSECKSKSFEQGRGRVRGINRAWGL